MRKVSLFMLLLIAINVAFVFWLLPYEQHCANGHIKPSLSALLLLFSGAVLIFFSVIKYWEKPRVMFVMLIYAVCFLFWAYKFYSLECNIIDG